jgi:hypothetical protein
MQVPGINGFQQIPKAVPLLHGANDQLTLFNGDVDRRAGGHLRLNGE